MRPSVLNPLFAGASGIKGIGQKLDKVLAQFLRGDATAPTRIVDLLFHLPSGVVDRRFRPKIADLPKEGIVTIEVKVGRHKPPPPFNKRLPYRVEVYDDTGTLTLVFFHAFADHLQRSLPEGETRFISGAISWYGEEPQIAHPDHILTAEDFSRMPLIEPVYPLTAGLSPKDSGAGHPLGAGAVAGPGGMAGCGLEEETRLAGFYNGIEGTAQSADFRSAVDHFANTLEACLR